MRTGSLALVLGLIAQAACAPESYQKIRIGLPAYSPMGVDSFRKIVLTNFLNEKPTKGFDLNRELQDYLEAGLSRRFKGQVTRQSISPPGEAAFSQKDFWLRQEGTLPDAVYLTGKAGISHETRKALRKTGPDLEDSPFKVKSWTLAEKKVFTLSLHLYLIRASTGENLFEREITETVAYEDSWQDEAFAFYDLLQKARHKIFRRLLGEEVVQQRYLITR